MAKENCSRPSAQSDQHGNRSQWSSAGIIEKLQILDSPWVRTVPQPLALIDGRTNSGHHTKLRYSRKKGNDGIDLAMEINHQRLSARIEERTVNTEGQSGSDELS